MTKQLLRVAKMYQAIWQDMKPEHQDRPVMRYCYATALLYCGRDDFLALSIFKDLALRTSTAAFDWVPRKAYKTIYRLVSDLAYSTDPQVRAGGLTSITLEYMEKLTAPGSTSKRDFMTGGRDPRLALARYHRYDDDDSKSRNIIRDIFADVFDTEPDVSDEAALDSRFWTFAAGLTVVDENEYDQSAIAAWRALGCMPPALDNFENDYFEKGKPAVYITVRCDGCGNRQSMMDLQHWCRDCLGLALCDKCYSGRLQTGGINPIVCGDNHSYLNVPRLTDDQLQALRPGEMVDETGTIVSRRTWIERLRAKWNLRPEQVEAKKTMEITELRASVIIVRCVTRWRLRVQTRRKTQGTSSV